MPLVVAAVFAVAGAIVGYGADRLSARWPEHEDGSVRPIDWRTAFMVVAGGVSFGALALRWSEPLPLAVLGAYFVALLVLMATDLDQKLLPDVITLPLVPIAVGLLVLV